MVHKRIGLEPRWYIAGYQFLLSELLEFLVASFQQDYDELTVKMKALSAAVMLDIELAMGAYYDA